MFYTCRNIYIDLCVRVQLPLREPFVFLIVVSVGDKFIIPFAEDAVVVGRINTYICVIRI